MNRVILILDKMEKIDRATLLKELAELALQADSLAKIEHFLDAKPSLDYFEYYCDQNNFIAQGIAEVRELMAYLQALQIDEACVFNPFLARGLEIYTGTIYEIFLADGAIKSSIGSGGRYDNAIGGLIGTDESFATVGISFGLDVIYTAFELAGKIEQNSCEIDVYIIPMNTVAEALQLATALRKTGQRVEVELSGKKVRKAMDKANRENVRKVIVLGENEVAANKVMIKDMASGSVDEVEFQF